MRRRHENKTKIHGKNTGFYIALAICILSVAGAAWSTYGSIAESAHETEESSELQADNDISGEDYESSDKNEQSKAEQSEDPSESEDEASARPANTDPVDNTSEQEMTCADPVEGGIVLKELSLNDLCYSKTTKDWRTHKGTDISAEKGVSVHAIKSGIVTSVAKDPLYGNIICIDHGNFSAKYCGLTDTPTVSAGTNVDSGDTIGYIGDIPCESLDESHLHLELTKDNTPVSLETVLNLKK